MLYHSTDGSDAAAAGDELVFPDTPVAAIAALDGDGRLASLAVLVVQPAGAGGSIVTVPVDADATGGSGGDRLPLDETLAVQGQEAFEHDLAAVLRLGIEDVAFVDASELATMLAPVGTIDVELPADVVGKDGALVASAGPAQLDAAAAAAVLTARDPGEQYRTAGAVWAAVAAALGPGLGSADPTATHRRGCDQRPGHVVERRRRCRVRRPRGWTASALAPCGPCRSPPPTTLGASA